MEWSERMNAAISYIEDNLEDEIDFNAAAQKAFCSTFHFQRMFFAIIGVTPAEYTRRRRLTLAAREITSTNARVIDVALKYGYDSPVSFARAFRHVHGINPLAARKPGVKLTAFPRLSFSIKLSGGNDVDYRIVEKPTFDVIGKGRKFTTNQGENFIKIPQFWQEFMASAEFQTFSSCPGESRTSHRRRHVGVIVPGKIITGTRSFTPYASKKLVKAALDLSVTLSRPQPGRYSTAPLPEIQDVTRRIFSEWFPSTRYEHDAKPEIEVYFPEDPRTKEIPCQIWIPIIKKN